MKSTWFDEVDLPFFDKSDKELQEKLQGLTDKWIFEFDTPQNREKMKFEFEEAIKKHYLPAVRNQKIDKIIGDDSEGI